MARFPAVRRPEIAVAGYRRESELSRRFPDTATCALQERRPRRLHFAQRKLGEKVPSPFLKRREAEPTCLRHGGRCEDRRRQLLGSGVDGLLTGDRRSDRLSFCLQEAGPRFRLSDRPFAWAGGWVDLCVLCEGGWADGYAVSKAQQLSLTNHEARGRCVRSALSA